jgi:hypothetical protein
VFKQSNIYIARPHRNDSIEVDKTVGHLRTYTRKPVVDPADRTRTELSIDQNKTMCFSKKTKIKLDFICKISQFLKDDRLSRT